MGVSRLVAAGMFGLLAVARPAFAAPQASGADPAAGSERTVEITAARPRTQVLIYRRVYTVGGDLQSSSGTAADVLNEVPSVDVDADGNVSLRGDANVTVLVDGRPSAQFSGAAQGLSLQQFAASDIDRVEVMTNPPARFKAEGSAGVINIITKKTRKSGLFGTAQLSVGDKRRYVAGLNGGYNVGKLKLSAGFNLRQDAKARLTTTNRAAIDPTSNTLAFSRESIDEHFRRLIPAEKLGAEYELSERESLSLTASHRELTGARFFDQHDTGADAAGAPAADSLRHSDGHEWALDEGESLRFDQKLWRPGETLSLSVQRSVTRERERYAYANAYALPAAPPSHDDLRLSLDLVTTQFSADYALPVAGDRELKLGYDFEDDNNAFDNAGDTIDPTSGLPVNNSNITNHFRYRQQIASVYGEYGTPIGPWRLQAGVRLEQTDVRTRLITGDVADGQGYFRAFPSLHLDRALSDELKLFASASRRVTRPDPQALNPFTDYQDTRNLRAGNAHLLPQDTIAYELGFTVDRRALSYGATGYVRFDRDSVTDVTQVISADVVLATKANLPKSRSGGMEFTANGKFTRRLSYNFSGNLFYSEIDASALGQAGLKSTVGLNGKASLDYRPTEVDTGQISVSRTDRRLTPQGYVDPINLVNLGYKRQLSPALSLVTTVSDALDGQRFHRLIGTPALTDSYLRHQVGQVAYVGFVYTFGAAKKAKASTFDYEQ